MLIACLGSWGNGKEEWSSAFYIHDKLSRPNQEHWSGRLQFRGSVLSWGCSTRSSQASLMLRHPVGLKRRSMHFLQTFLLRRAFRGNHIWDWPFLVWWLHLSSSNSGPFHICCAICSPGNATCNVLAGYWCCICAVVFWELVSNHPRLKLKQLGKMSVL